jgi:hypothetical protein
MIIIIKMNEEFAYVIIKIIVRINVYSGGGNNSVIGSCVQPYSLGLYSSIVTKGTSTSNGLVVNIVEYVSAYKLLTVLCHCSPLNHYNE